MKLKSVEMEAREIVDAIVVKQWQKTLPKPLLDIIREAVSHAIDNERQNASALVIDFAGSDENWMAMEILKGSYGKGYV